MKSSKKKELIHLIDIGNTSATYGISKGKTVLQVQSVNTDKIPEILLKNIAQGTNYSNIIVISSVVPQNTQKIKSSIYAHIRGATIYEIGKDIPIKIKHKYRNIHKLGLDRKINAFGASKSNNLPCLVFDFGTALTCDLIDDKGVFLGGLIIPGPATSLQTLLAKTALLPKTFNLKPEKGRPYGRNTNDCIQHGVIQAYAAMTDGLITTLSKEFKKKPRIIITGGFSSFIGKIIRSKAEINPAHTLESMLQLYLDWKS